MFYYEGSTRDRKRAQRQASKARRMAKMTPAQLVANHHRLSDPPECTHGHMGCSCTAANGGPCFDEMLSRLGR